MSKRASSSSRARQVEGRERGQAKAQAKALRRIGRQGVHWQGYGLTPWAIIGATCCRYNASASASAPARAQQVGYLCRWPSTVDEWQANNVNECVNECMNECSRSWFTEILIKTGKKLAYRMYYRRNYRSLSNVS